MLSCLSSDFELLEVNELRDDCLPLLPVRVKYFEIFIRVLAEEGADGGEEDFGHSRGIDNNDFVDHPWETSLEDFRKFNSRSQNWK